MEIYEETLKAMRESECNYETTRWAAYRNVAMDSDSFGHMQFLATGPDNTHHDVPLQPPDGPAGLGWKYRFFGWANLESGKVIECSYEERNKV